MGVDGMSPHSNECPNTAHFINLFISNSQTSPGLKQIVLSFIFVTDNNDSYAECSFFKLLNGMVSVRTRSFLFVFLCFFEQAWCFTTGQRSADIC